MYGSKKKSQGNLKNKSNENITYHYVKDSPKVVLQEKFVLLNFYIRKDKGLKPVIVTSALRNQKGKSKLNLKQAEKIKQ